MSKRVLILLWVMSLQAFAVTQEKMYEYLTPEVLMNPQVQTLLEEHPSQVVVIEFFNYGCFGCSRLQPFLEKWLEHKNSSVVFQRVPVVFNKRWEVLAKAYYLNQSAKILTDEDFFHAIFDKKEDVFTRERLASFLEKHQLSAEKFGVLWDSFGVNQQLNQAKTLAKAHQINVSPSIVVHRQGKGYILTPNKFAGDHEKLITVLNHLVLEGE